LVPVPHVNLDPIAVYGAVVATFALGWQAYAWHRDRATNVEVKLGNALLTFGTDVREAALVTVVNRSRHAIRVDSLGLELQDGSGRTAFQPYAVPGATIPGTVPALDSGGTWWGFDELVEAGFDPYRPIVARVTLSTGERVRSKSTALRSKPRRSPSTSAA
jgi:hypothetical protein